MPQSKAAPLLVHLSEPMAFGFFHCQLLLLRLHARLLAWFPTKAS